MCVAIVCIECNGIQHCPIAHGRLSYLHSERLLARASAVSLFGLLRHCLVPSGLSRLFCTDTSAICPLHLPQSSSLGQEQLIKMLNSSHHPLLAVIYVKHVVKWDEAVA